MHPEKNVLNVLVVVDMQKDFVDGSLGTPEAQAIVPRVVAKIQAYRQAGGVILVTQDTHGPTIWTPRRAAACRCSTA